VLVVGAAGFVPALSATRGWIASPVQLGVGLCALTAATYFGSWGPAEVYTAVVCLTLPYFIVAAVAVAMSRPGGVFEGLDEPGGEADATTDDGRAPLLFGEREDDAIGAPSETDAQEVRRAA